MKKTVVICDTQPIAIEGLRALITEHHDLAVAGEATSLMAGMELVRNLSPSMLIRGQRVRPPAGDGLDGQPPQQRPPYRGRRLGELPK